MGNKTNQPQRQHDEGVGTGQLVDGLHGDPARNNCFWVYPRHKSLVTPRWDTHSAPLSFCTNCRHVGRDGGIQKYQCLGHDFVERSTESGAPGSGQLQGGFHGDPNRGNRFWVYPRTKDLVHERWDTHQQATVFCSRCELVSRHWDGVQEYCCLGHPIQVEVSRWDPEDVQRLQELGFTQDAVQYAMARSDGDVTAAAAHLLDFGNASEAANSFQSRIEKEDKSRARELPPSRRSSIAIEEFWARDLLGEGPVEYQTAQHLIAVHPSLMSTSCMQRTLTALDHAIASSPLSGTFTSTATDAVLAAFQLSSRGVACQFRLHIPDIASGHAVQDVSASHDALSPWHQPYLHAAIRELTRAVEAGDDPTTLQLVLGYLVRGARECAARRQWAFVQALNAARDSLNVTRVSARVGERGGGGGGGGGARGDDDDEEAKREFVGALHSVIDELKGRAFQTVFVEPTLAYARAARDHVMEGDVDVHGANVYLAVLLSTLGVRLARQPLLRDDVKAVVNFLDADLKFTNSRGKSTPLLPALWHGDNFGRASGSLRAVTGPTPARATCKPGLPVRRHHFFFGGRTALEVAKSAVQGGEETRRARRGLAVCLEQFSSYFSRETISERLVGTILAREELEAAADRVCATLQREGAVQHARIREVAWAEDEEGEWRLQLEAVAGFLVAVGVLRA